MKDGNQLPSTSFAERLKQGPNYLFFGQRWLVDSTGTDPFLSQSVKKFCPASLAASTNYSAILDAAPAQEQVALEWMAGRCRNITASERAETVAKFHWNGIFTSAIDDILAGLLRSPARDVQRIPSLDYHPSDPRSRSKLHVWYLFGNVAAAEERGRPPLTRLGLIRRQSIATQMTAQLAELVTSLGTLVIEGYDPETDWLKAELFYSIVSSFSPGQVHWFGAHDALAKNPLIEPLVRSGQIALHTESLAQVMVDAGLGPKMIGGLEIEEEGWSRRLRIANRVVSVPHDVFQQVQATARLITEDVFAPLKKLSPDQEYSEFRRFLGESSHRPPWEAFARGYAFRRDFQGKLQDAVRAQLLNPSERGRGEPVILHGATGSGKTVALGQLAFDLQREGASPVLFIDRGTRVRHETLDRFCQWAQEAEAAAVVIVWDGMGAPRDYLDLHGTLSSRGRKFVMVGSTYQTDINFQRARNSVSADPKMGSDERKRFIAFLKAANFSEMIPYLRESEDDNFLGQLYRALPATRFPLQAGLGREVAHTTDLIRRQKLVLDTPSGPFGTNLGSVFSKLGIDLPQIPFGEKKELIDGEHVNESEQLIGLVMVPGQFGLACPFELLMRTLSREAGGRLVEILRKFDIFHLREDNVGNPVVEARTALEARLIARSMLGGAKGEVDYAIRLLGNVRASYITDSREVDFAVELLRSIGPNGFQEEYYRPYFVQLAACLHDLRTNRGVRHVRLLLQESAFLREAAKATDNEAVADMASEKRKRLEQALEACREALAQLNDHRADRGMKSRLLVEMASTLGTLTTMESDPAARLILVTQAHEAAWRAFTINSSNHYALDVVAWTARDTLQAGGLTSEERTKLIESVAHVFALADAEEWDAEAANQLDRRRYELRDLIFNSEVSQEAFERMLNRGSAAGVVVRAWQLSEADAEKPAERKSRAAVALSWMEEVKHRNVVLASPHAMFLRFKLWWLSRLGADFNAAEKMPLPFSPEDWDQCLALVSQLLAFDQFQEHPTLRLIEAVAYFHRGEAGRGFSAFEAMNVDLLFARNRVVRRFLFSDSHGKARRFSGSVVKVDGRDGALQVQGFTRRIPFFANEAHRADLRRGDDLSGFGIAFNMLGPIAEFRFSEARL